MTVNARASSSGRRRTALTTFCGVALLIAGTLARADVSVYGTLTSEYIYRGLDRSDRNPAAQFGIDLDITDNFFAGAWISTVNIRNPNGGRDYESNVYAGAHYGINNRLSVTATLLRYRYPGAEGSHKYDHNEGLLTISWDSRYAIEYAYTGDARGLGRRGTHVLVSADWPLGNGWILGANAGRYDLSSIRLPAYVHGNVGLSTRWSRITFDARLYGNEHTGDERLDDQAAGTRFVISVSAAF